MKNKGKFSFVLMNLESWYFNIKRALSVLLVAKSINTHVIID